MTSSIKTPYYFVPLCFFIIGLICIGLLFDEPLHDFGNYYYGSKLWYDGQFDIDIYKSIGWFNNRMVNFGESDCFGNYIPVPPVTALVYLPLLVFKAFYAKLIFNFTGLLLFCFQLFRLLRLLRLQSQWLLCLPAIFLGPLYYNILQGQTYVLISAVLIEVVIRTEKKQSFILGFLIAFISAIKLFPLFILIHYLLTKQYKTTIWTFFWLICIHLISLVFIDKEILKYYYFEILPRLLQNEVIGIYEVSNQSIYSLLVSMFSYDAFHNPDPVKHWLSIIPLVESIISTFCICFLIISRKMNTFYHFALCFLILSLIGRYNASYALFLLLPFAVFLLINCRISRLYIVAVLMISIACYMPFLGIRGGPLLIQYIRLFCLAIIFLLIVYQLKFRWHLSLLFPVFLLIFFIKYISFSLNPIYYYTFQNSKGVLQDLEVDKDSKSLHSTIGSSTFIETFANTDHIKSDTELVILNKRLTYKGKIISDTKDNILKAFVINDTNVLVLSDLNQAVGFYKLRVIRKYNLDGSNS